MEVDSVTFVTMIIGNKFAALQELPSYLHLMANITLQWGGTMAPGHLRISESYGHRGHEGEPLPTPSWPLTICWHQHRMFLSQPFPLLIGWMWPEPAVIGPWSPRCHWWLAGLRSPLDLLQPDISRPLFRATEVWLRLELYKYYLAVTSGNKVRKAKISNNTFSILQSRLLVRIKS